MATCGGGQRQARPSPLVSLLRPDAMGDRFVGRVELRVDLLATPVPPPGWADGG